MEHRFNYNWTLKDAIFTKDKGKVFSCFACGGGSTMGYKLAGFDVIGCNEIDIRVMNLYESNHHPRYKFLEPIQTFKERTAFPEALYNLDILDGSPPCSAFSIKVSSFPQDYDFGTQKPEYICGMSVPPIMIAQIATQVYEQWLTKLTK